MATETQKKWFDKIELNIRSPLVNGGCAFDGEGSGYCDRGLSYHHNGIKGYHKKRGGGPTPSAHQLDIQIGIKLW